MKNRIETLLNAVINGETIEFTPRSRMEEYLKSCINKAGIEGLPDPQSRADALLYTLTEAIASGSIGTGGGNSGLKQALKVYFDHTKDASYFFSRQRVAFDPTSDDGNPISDDEIASLLTYESTEKVENSNYMFFGCKNITRIPNLNILNLRYAGHMFDGCVKLLSAEITFGDGGRGYNDLSLGGLFSNCVSLTSATIHTGSKAKISCGEMFRGCKNLQIYSLANISIETTYSMFYDCTSLVGGAPLDTRAVNSFDCMFYNCTSLVEAPILDYSMSLSTNSQFSTRSMFYNCTALKKAPNIESPGGAGSRVQTWMTDKMFYGCSSLEDISGVVDTLIPLSKNMDNMFYGCTALKALPNLNLQQCSRLYQAFTESGLVNAGDINAPVVDSAYQMFYNCKSLTNVENISMPIASTLEDAFYQCSSLERVGSIYAPKVTNMSDMFYGCTALTTIKSLDMRNATSVSNFLWGCRSLTNLTLLNIKTSLTVTYSSWGHLLTVDSLVKLIYECRDTGSIKTLTIANINREKLANVYVKTIDITDEMRAEDDLIDEKLPFVVCESTDEGAMLITSYITLKNWKLA